VVPDIHERREEGRVGLDDGVRDPAQVNRDAFIQKSEMADVIAVVMGKEDGIDVRTLVGRSVNWSMERLYSLGIFGSIPNSK